MESPQITRILAAWKEGDPDALARLTPLVYDELHRLAAAYLATERQGHLLQPTALVNEAFLRLMQWQPEVWQSRGQFFGVSATLMRRILVQFAREQRALKRGGGAFQLSLADLDDAPAAQSEVDLVSVDDALERLAALDSRQARIVEMRFFGGLSHEEIASLMEVSLSTVRREWRMARAWLHQQLAPTVP